MSRKVSSDDMSSSEVAPSLRNLGDKIEIDNLTVLYVRALLRDAS